MRYGSTLPPFADWSDPRVVMRMAADQEAAGWDGFFLWSPVWSNHRMPHTSATG
jgi:hypothetical protein